MIEYGLLASQSSDIFFNTLYSFKDLFHSNPYIMTALGAFAVIFYFVVWK